MRKPALLAVLERIYSEGIGWTTWDWGRQWRREPPPGRITAPLIADVLALEADLAVYMAQVQDPNPPPPAAGSLRSVDELTRSLHPLRLLEHHVEGIVKTVLGVRSQPTDDTVFGATDTYMTGFMTEDHREWKGRAQGLRRDLGERFRTATRDERATMVRGWIREYREQGRLPRNSPPT